MKQVPIAMLLLTLSAVSQTPTISAPPAAPKHPVTDEYHGIKVTDDYRWLENWDDPEVKQWTAVQDARTRAYFNQLRDYNAIHDRIAQLLGTPSIRYDTLQFTAGTLFALQYVPQQQQPLLVALRSPDDTSSARVIFDPNRLSDRGSIAINFYNPSANGKYVVVVLSKDESEEGDAHVLDTGTGEEIGEVVPRVYCATGLGSVAWKPDNTGFYYTRYPRGKERPPQELDLYPQIYFHKLGTNTEQDTYVIGKDFPAIAEIALDVADDGWLLAKVANGDGGQIAFYLMDAKGHWRQIAGFNDGIAAIHFGEGVDLFVLCRKNSPRGRILRVSRERPDLNHAKLIVPQTSGMGAESDHPAIEDFFTAGKVLYVMDVVGGPSRIRVFDRNGHRLTAPSLPPVSAVYQNATLKDHTVLFQIETYLDPPAWYHYDPASGETTRTALHETSPIKFDDAEVVREFATSKDGTKIPLNIIRLKTTRLDGSNPLLLTAYGGYGVSQKPDFEGYLMGFGPRLWLDHGGIFVVANVRGGGEFGEEWHAQGYLTHKQNVFDDVVASAQYLLDRRYTSPRHLALVGQSNGGLMAGVVVTQHPDLFRAVVADAGWYDSLRVELSPNGQVGTNEFGTVKDPEQFKALYAYSSYHHVKDGTPYPAIYLFAGANDNRVDPMQSRKMTARLQAATNSGLPILLRFELNAGHGWGEALNTEIGEYSDIMSFLFDQMGIAYGQGGKDKNTGNR